MDYHRFGTISFIIIIITISIIIIIIIIISFIRKHQFGNGVSKWRSFCPGLNVLTLVPSNMSPS